MSHLLLRFLLNILQSSKSHPCQTEESRKWYSITHANGTFHIEQCTPVDGYPKHKTTAHSFSLMQKCTLIPLRALSPLEECARFFLALVLSILVEEGRVLFLVRKILVPVVIAVVLSLVLV